MELKGRQQRVAGLGGVCVEFVVNMLTGLSGLPGQGLLVPCFFFAPF